MYFIAQVILAIIIFAFLLYLIFSSVFEKKIVLKKKFINILVLFIIITTVINIILNILSYLKTKDKIALKGRKGIPGKMGKTGNKGFCNNKCGQNVCYINVVDKANEKFNELLLEKFKEKDNNNEKDFEKKKN